MNDIGLKIVDELENKISRKTFVLTLLIIWIIQFDISQFLLIPIIKSTWLGWILSTLILIIMNRLINKSEKEGIRQYFESLVDDTYEISCDEISLKFENHRKYKWNPSQEIVLFNTSSKEIAQISGHIDFYWNDIRNDSITFDITDIPCQKGHLIACLKSSEWKTIFDYLIIYYSIFDEHGAEMCRGVQKGKKLLHIPPELDRFPYQGRDLNWLKEKATYFKNIIRFHWSQHKCFTRPSKTTNPKEYRQIRKKESKELCAIIFRRLIIVLLSVIILGIISAILLILAYTIYKFIAIHWQWVAEYFSI